ncbi:hypothetical protein [Nonlabens xiamenensis]|uniref:hypothetical protein n=1 Tax=Nonlabens xiamenensis TaxID=2341043 RepID=UPI000F608CF1|nr:hypothetical protein [Nonlabens xiamenensis]
MKNRQITFSNKLSLYKKYPIQIFIGGMFTFFPLLIFIPISLILISQSNDTPKVDYDSISNNGITSTATISDIEIITNTTINGEHPAIISYVYNADKSTYEDKVKILDSHKVNNWSINDTIDIKHLNGKSIIVDSKPFEFPWGIFIFIPFVFAAIGIPFLIYAIKKVRAEIRLYKEGTVKTATILAIVPNSGLPITNIGQSITIHYQWTELKKQTSNCKTTDFSILGDYKKGDLIKILVNEDKPSITTIYPDLIAKQNCWSI